MKNFSMDVLKEFSEVYEYDFTESELKTIYNELTFQTEYIKVQDILDEFDWFRTICF